MTSLLFKYLSLFTIGTYLGNMRKTIFRGNTLPTPSSGDEVFSGGERRKKFVKKRKTERSNSIPLVSARAEDNLSFLSESMVKFLYYARYCYCVCP